MNINDYITSYSDKTFKDAPFNEVDNLIFSELIYIPFDDVVSSWPTTLKSAAKKLFEKDIRFKKLQYSRMLKLLAESKRYGNILLTDYLQINDADKQEQFAAITIQYKLFDIYVAFRGTDRNIYSFKEDLNMMFQLPIPAQKQAEDYLNKQIKKHPFCSFTVGGHSKGGNLAVYSSVLANKNEKIVHVYNNDGPGFNHDFVKTDKYQNMLNKMETILPQSSIVGLLMNSDIENIIINSDADLLHQHDGFSWQIEDNHFIREKDTTKQSKFIEGAMNGWGNKLSMEDKIVFINSLYDVFTSLNINTIDEMKGKKATIVLELLEKMRLSEGDDRKMYIETTKAMLKSFSSSFIETYITGRQETNENTSIK